MDLLLHLLALHFSQRPPCSRSSGSFCFLRNVGLSTGLRCRSKSPLLPALANSLMGLRRVIFSLVTTFFFSIRRSMVFSSLLNRFERLSGFSSFIAFSLSFGDRSSRCSIGSSYSPARLVDARDLAPLMLALLRFDVDPVLEKDVAMSPGHVSFLMQSSRRGSPVCVVQSIPLSTRLWGGMCMLLLQA
jgi:hypothetical protein